MSDVRVAGVIVPHPDAVFVGGDWIPASGAAYEVVAPATEQPVAEVVLPAEKGGPRGGRRPGARRRGSSPNPQKSEAIDDE
jgi:hypothetical protein